MAILSVAFNRAYLYFSLPTGLYSCACLRLRRAFDLIMARADQTSLLRAVAETFATLGVVARRVGDGFHSLRHRHPPTSNTDSSGTTTRVSSASFATAIYTAGLNLVDDCFASQLRFVFVIIQRSLISIQ